MRDAPDLRIERGGAIAPGHFRQRDHLDLPGIAGRAELLEPVATKLAQGIHRGLEELARVELALRLDRDLAEGRSHRQTAIGIDVDLAHAMLDAADDFRNRNTPGLWHL